MKNKPSIRILVFLAFLLSACGSAGTSRPTRIPFPTYDFPEPGEIQATFEALEAAQPTHTPSPTITQTPTATPLPPPPSLDEARRIYQERIQPLYAALNGAAEKSDTVLSPSSTWRIQLVPGSEREYLIQYLLFGEQFFGNPVGETLVYITYSYQREGCLGITGLDCSIQKAKLLSQLVIKADNGSYVKLEELPPFGYGVGAHDSAEIISQSVNPYEKLGDQTDEIHRTMQVLLWYVGGLDPFYTGQDVVQPAGNVRLTIMRLVLGSPYWSDRRAVLHSMETFAGLQVYPEIIQALYDEDAHVQSGAAALLGQIGPPAADAVPDLVKIVQDPDSGIRCEAFTALGDIGAQAGEGIPLMITEVETGGNCQEMAIKALEKFGAAAAPAIPALEKVVTGDQGSYLQLVAAHALAAIGEPALESLIVCLGQDDTTLRYVAANAIIEIGPAASAAVPALVRALEESETASAYTFFNALGSIGPGASQAVPVLVKYLPDEKLREHAVKALGKIGPAAMASVPELVKLLNEESYLLRMDVSDALQAITGQDLGMEAAPWQDWWDANKPGA